MVGTFLDDVRWRLWDGSWAEEQEAVWNQAQGAGSTTALRTLWMKGGRLDGLPSHGFKSDLGVRSP